LKPKDTEFFRGNQNKILQGKSKHRFLQRQSKHRAFLRENKNKQNSSGAIKTHSTLQRESKHAVFLREKYLQTRDYGYNYDNILRFYYYSYIT
jgi:hypothetical protein